MKTKIIILFFTSVMIFFYSCCSFAQNNLSEDQQIRAMLKEFYTTYISEIGKKRGNNERINWEKINAIPKEYCTVRLLKEIENDKELDYDPFINAQDADLKSLKTLSIKKNIEVPNGYVVTYGDSFGKEEVSIIKVVVVKEKDGYKIDSVGWDGVKKYGVRS